MNPVPSPSRRAPGVFAGLATLLVAATAATAAAALPVVVEVEEEVYRYAPANNGAGPMWCSGSTCLVRLGDTVFATGLETLPDAKPLNNCRWVLWRRPANGAWERVFVDDGRTREPSPLAVLRNEGVLVVSANPTLQPPDKEGGGPARPVLIRFDSRADAPPTTWTPAWDGEPAFTEHSYRSFAADGDRGDLLLLQNIGYTHAEWSFRDAGGRTASGRLKWPWGADYAKPQPIRVCYPNVALHRRAVHFVGVSDILEPNPTWRAYKRELTGREWDYDFRRLFYTWTPDLPGQPFHEWIEIASREATGGGISPADLWLAPNGEVHLIWTERAIDERLRPRFFPEARQSHALNYARLRDGRIELRRTLLESTEDCPGPVVAAARFHVLPDDRLLVVAFVSEGGRSGNRLYEIDGDGRLGPAVKLRLERPFTHFFTATPRAGSAPSATLDLLGVRQGTGDAIGYARLRVGPAPRAESPNP